MKRLSWELMAFGLAVLLSPFARADYAFTTVDVPGATFTSLTGINDSGQMIGFYVAAGIRYDFLLSDGTYTTLYGPNGTGAFANGINNAGQIVGYYFGADGLVHGFLRDSDGTYTTLDFPGFDSLDTEAYGINDSGQIVGQYYGGGRIHGFLRDSYGRYTRFDAQGAFYTMLTGINHAGVLLGNTIDDDGGNGAFYFDSSFEPIIPVPGSATYAFGINDVGDIVGFYGQPDGSSHGYLRSADGNYTSLDVPDAQLTCAYGINNNGIIVGSFDDQQNHTHGFVATPQ
jgi:probable HAF family extracellular repeat protein